MLISPTLYISITNTWEVLTNSVLSLYRRREVVLKFSQLEFLRSLVKQYIQNHQATRDTPDIVPHIVEMETNGNYLMSASQGLCKYCKKNNAKMWKMQSSTPWNMHSAIPSVNSVVVRTCKKETKFISWF